MTILRGFGIVIVSAVGFGFAGATIGGLLGAFVPDYYRTVFSAGDKPGFNPLAVGIGLGTTQGIGAGIAIGVIIVLVVAWHQSQQVAQRHVEPIDEFDELAS